MNRIELFQEDLSPKLLDKTKWFELGLDPNKGLLLMGKPGVGKTYFLKAWIRHQERSIHQLTAYDIEQGFLKEGLDYRYRYSFGDLFIDDIGIESDMINTYGTKRYPVQTMIFYRHQFFLTGSGVTHFTTNLNIADIRAKYGERVLDRLYEMCNFVVVTGTSYRGR